MASRKWVMDILGMARGSRASSPPDVQVVNDDNGLEGCFLLFGWKEFAGTRGEMVDMKLECK
jgi:hypothetical protein